MRDKTPPADPSGPSVLHPLLGTYCRTQSFALNKAPSSKPVHIHYEIYLEDPVRQTWAVNKIVMTAKFSFSRMKETADAKITRVAKDLTFAGALQSLVWFEADHNSKPGEYTPLYPEPAQMGFIHYKAFAEREGYVFDAQGSPRPRPHADVLPDGEFLAENIASAQKNLARPADAFGNNGVANKIPNTLFIFDTFNRAAAKDGFAQAVNETRILNLLDRFAEQVGAAHAKMKEYCEKYGELGQGQLIIEAEAALSIADSSVNQLRAYGVEITEYSAFVLQCQIVCNVLHAQGLYDLMHQGKGDYEKNETAFKNRVTRAVENYRKTQDATDKGVELLHDMIVHAGAPQAPEAIGLFLEKYKTQRQDFSAAREARQKKSKFNFF